MLTGEHLFNNLRIVMRDDKKYLEVLTTDVKLEKGIIRVLRFKRILNKHIN